jgi:hypothetical protein
MYHSCSQPAIKTKKLIMSTARNGLSIDASGFVILGEPVGSATQPAKILDDQEIPMNSFDLDWLTGSNQYFAISGGGQFQTAFYNGNQNTSRPIVIFTKQGFSPGSNPYGNFYVDLDQTYLNSDGQYDSALSIGYNLDGTGNKVNPNEAAFGTVLESHYLQFPPDAQFEWYLTSYAKDGNNNRHIFMVVDKVNGFTNLDFAVDNFQFAQTAVSGGLTYAGWSIAGLTLNGKAGSNVTFVMESNAPNTDAAFAITCLAGSNGVVSFGLAGTGTSRAWEFLNGGFVVDANLALGGNAIALNSSVTTAGTKALVVTNSVTGTTMMQVYNDGHLALNPTFVGFVNSATPGAYLELASGTAVANSAPLKFDVGTFNTTPVQGCVEYDGTNWTFVQSTGRQNIWTGNNGASAPSTTAGTGIANFYGTSATNFLGTPRSWAQVVLPGGTFKIPLY